MSALKKHPINTILFLLCIVINQLVIAGVEGDKIDQGVAEGGTAVVHTGTGDVEISITLEQYEQGLKRREAELTERLEKTRTQDSKLLKTQLNDIRKRSQYVKQSYQEHLKNLRKRIAKLESIRGQVPDDLLDKVQAAMAQGDMKQADELFKQLEGQAQGTYKAAAEAAFQRCQIARDDIRYQEALSHCKRAQQLVTDNTTYLFSVADLARKLGDYRLAKDNYEQVLANDLKTYGEEHLIVAQDRNNLGTVLCSLGEYRKAIGYYEQALASVLKSYGEGHPRVAALRNNLGSAWKLLGEYRKAIEYFEQTLTSILRTYGEGHSRVAILRNNIGLAWVQLEEYRKAIEYFDQALASVLKRYGEGHANVAELCINLGSAWDSLGEYRKAIGYYEQALKSYGEGHPYVVIVRNSLGSAWEALGESQKAISYYEQALKSAEEKLGPDHTMIKRIRQNLAEARKSATK